MRSLRLLAVLVSLACAFAAAACGGGGAGSETGPLRLFPFRYVSGTGDYVYSLGSPDSIPIQLHRDVDPSRFAMTYGDGVSWLFLGKPGSDDLILFRYSAGAGAYVEAAWR